MEYCETHETYKDSITPVLQHSSTPFFRECA